MSVDTEWGRIFHVWEYNPPPTRYFTVDDGRRTVRSQRKPFSWSMDFIASTAGGVITAADARNQYRSLYHVLLLCALVRHCCSHFTVKYHIISADFPDSMIPKYMLSESSWLVLFFPSHFIPRVRNNIITTTLPSAVVVCFRTIICLRRRRDTKKKNQDIHACTYRPMYCVCLDGCCIFIWHIISSTNNSASERCLIENKTKRVRRFPKKHLHHSVIIIVSACGLFFLWNIDDRW